MAIDHYSPCPCGSGKKLKFCKCVDNMQDFERVIKLVSGGQGVAALDRINQLLAKTPNTAWLMAIKGELTLQLREFESFCENAKRFLKLKPANPAALMMRALAAVIQGEPNAEIAKYYHDSLAESPGDPSPISALVVHGILDRLSATEQLCMAGGWLVEDDTYPVDQTVVGEVLANRHVSLLSKYVPQTVPGPSGAGWKERLAEVRSLVRTSRYSQAEAKLRSILRDFPDAAEPLSHLLVAQYMQLDQDGAAATAAKLAQHPELDETQRFYFGGLALNLDPKRSGTNTSSFAKYAEIESADEAIALLESLENTIVAGDGSEDSIDYVRRINAEIVGDEVPAKVVYGVYDAPLSTTDDREYVASMVGSVAVLARQTDKPVRILVQAYGNESSIACIHELINQLNPGADIEQELTPSTSYTSWIARPRVKVSSAGRAQVDLADAQQILFEDFMSCDLVALDGKTPAQVKDDPAYRDKLGGLACHFAASQATFATNETVQRILDELAIQFPQAAPHPKTGYVDLFAFSLTPCESASDDVLLKLMECSLTYGLQRQAIACANAFMARPHLQDRHSYRRAALLTRLNNATDEAEALNLLDSLEECCVIMNAPVGEVIMRKCGVLASLGRDDEARETMTAAVQKYPEDPQLMAILQQIMANHQRAEPSPSSTAASGLVLPGQDAAPAGESKLWLPGS